MVTLKTRPISFVVLVFLANLTGVVDLFNEGACNWSCAVENANATGEALRKAMAGGRLLKLTIMYKERVESERCASETKQDKVITNTILKVLWKPSIDHQANRMKGSMAFITQSILEFIYSGKVFTKSDIEMKVSCISEPTSVKNFSTNFSYQRLTPLLSPQSILYYIENLANYTKTNSTLVLVRVDQHTRISLVTTSAAGNRSSHTLAKDNELLTLSDRWLAIVIIIWIIFALYSPLIFLLFRPSKLNVKLPENHLSPPIQEAEDDEGYYERLRNDRQPPTENEDEILDENDENNQSSAEGESLSEPRELRTEEVVCQSTSREETISNDSGIERTRLCSVNAATCCSVYSDLGNTDDHSSHDGAIANEEHVITNSGYTLCTRRRETCMIPFFWRGTDEERSSFGESPSDVVESTEQNPLGLPVQSSSRSVHETSEANYTHLIIAGDTNPIGIGSFIGNRCFSSLYLGLGFWLKLGLKTIRSIIIFITPFCFIGLWDLSLYILPSFPKQISVNLPSPFLFDSLYHSILIHRTLVLVVSSAVCYFIRLFSVCYFLSEYSEQTRIPWSLYSNRIKCVVYRGMQLLLSKLPPSSCNSSTRCRGRCWQCRLCFICRQFFVGVRKFLSPESYEENVNGNCSEHFDVPQNISLTLEKQASITADYCNSFIELCTGYNKTNVLIRCIKMIFSPLAIIPFVLEIIWSSPLIYLCHENQWFLREKFKNKFGGSYYVCSFLDIVFCGFSLVWLILIWGIGCAVPLGVLLIGTIKKLASNTNEMLPEVIIIIFSVHYLWSCYSAFTKFYYDLANKLASSYQKKYDKKNQSERDDLIYYRLGEEEHSIKVIPEELFKNALREGKLLVRIKVAYLLFKLFFTFLSLSFVWPIISSESVMAQSSPVGVLAITITFFAAAYPLINNRINGGELDVSTEDVDKIVDDYIRIRPKRGPDH